MSIFVNTVTKECGVYDPKDLDDNNWIQAPKGTQAVYTDLDGDYFFFYKIQKNDLMVTNIHGTCCISTYTSSSLAKCPLMQHLYGTLQDFEF